MKKCFISLDLEEWYHLDYFKHNHPDTSVRVIPQLGEFLDLLERNQIRISIFVLGELIADNRELIRELDRRGHALGIHGWDHRLLFDETPEAFADMVTRAKRELEAVVGHEVSGYRAPCFSMDDRKLEVLARLGFRYDSSYIRFKEHPLYGRLDLSSWEKREDLIYRKDGLYEFEIPTLDILGHSIPISGGGYFRLFPAGLFRHLFKRYQRLHQNFVFYIHPFELSAMELPVPAETGALTGFRFSVGRRNNLKKLETFLKQCREEAWSFETFEDYVKAADCEKKGGEK